MSTCNATLREQFADLWRTVMRPIARHYGVPVLLGIGPVYWVLRFAGGRDRADQWRDELIRTAQDADRG